MGRREWKGRSGGGGAGGAGAAGAARVAGAAGAATDLGTTRTCCFAVFHAYTIQGHPLCNLIQSFIHSPYRPMKRLLAGQGGSRDLVSVCGSLTRGGCCVYSCV